MDCAQVGVFEESNKLGLTKGDGSWAVPVGHLHASGGWGGLASCLDGKLFAWGLASGGHACGLLGTDHV